MLYPQKPHNYTIEMEVAACIIEHKWEILLLQRCAEHRFWGTWSEPGGKLDPGENHEEAMIREVYEESWINIQPWASQKLFKKYHCFDDTNIAISFYYIVLTERPDITLSSSEHSDYCWISPKESLKMNLIEDFDEILREIYSL